MCRLTGIWDFNFSGAYDLASVAESMRDCLAHGGPDSSGLFLDEKSALALGHRRLSIIDLTEAGSQPMFFEQFTIIFNGEIYNYKEIKEELSDLGYSFTTDSDTEVILKAFHKWRYDCVLKFHGMFAFAIWDKEKERLILCRDRVGVKPLYWYHKNGLFLFASELKAFHKHPEFQKEINQSVIPQYLKKGFIESPDTIFNHTFKLEPGSFLIVEKQKVTKKVYWSPSLNMIELPDSEGDLIALLEKKLKYSFGLRMVSDVPVGVLLSGGVDSSLVAAVLSKVSKIPLRTFTIAFEDKELNEGEAARAVANHLGTDHTELYCSEKEALELLPKFFETYDEPFGDSSAIPTMLVSRLARENVKVCLSADGADEVFGGYVKYEIAKKVSPYVNNRSFLLKGLKVVLKTIDPTWLQKISRHLPYLKKYQGIARKFAKLRLALNSKGIEEFFHKSGQFADNNDLKKILLSIPKETRDIYGKPVKNQLISFLGMIDVNTYLENDILTKVDRATMSVGLEGREPFLDQDLIDFGLSLPDHFKYRNGENKYLLRRILEKYLKPELINKKKRGFEAPIDSWLKGPLKKDLEELSKDLSFHKTFKFDTPGLENLIKNYLYSKKYIDPQFVWFIYVLHRWNRSWMS